jgi:itaconyl-CoA hydratase
MTPSGYLRVGPDRYRERFGLSFEDAAVGMRIHHRPGVDISQQDNRLDALDLINNAQLHYDSHYAARTAWEKPLGVSTLTVQRLVGMTSRSWYRRRRILGIDNIAMTKPVFAGDTLYAASDVTDVVDGGDPDVGEVALTISGSNQRGETVSEIKARIEICRRGHHPEDLDDDAGAEPADEPRFQLYHEASDGTLMEQTGLYFEDLVAGETFVHWPGRTIDFAESRLHALRSLELNPRWADAAYLSSHPQLSREVWEPLVLGAVTALTTRTLGRVMANLGWTGIELPRPVRAGETLYAESTIGHCRLSVSRPSLGIAEVETRGYVGTGELVGRYQRSLFVYRRGLGPYTDAGY